MLKFGLILAVMLSAVGVWAQETTPSAPVLPISATVTTQYIAPYQIALNGDGSQMVVVSAATDAANAGRTALQWFTSGQQTDLVREGQTLYQVAFHPFLPQFVTTTTAGEVAVWDTATLTVTSSVQGHESEPQVVFSPDGEYRVTLDWSGIILWSAITNEPTFFLASGNTADDPPAPLAISSDGQYMAWVTLPATINVAALASGDIVARLETGYDIEPYRIGFTPDNQLALAYGTLEVWDIGTGQLTDRIITSEAVRDFAYSADGTRLVLLEADNVVRVLDTATRQIQAIANERGGQAWGMVLSANGKRLALGLDGSVVLYELE